jgi:hypothetical protein
MKHVGREGPNELEDYVFDVFAEEDDEDGSNTQPKQPKDSVHTTLSNDSLNRLLSAGSDFDIKTGSILAPILIPRALGTPGSTSVQ